MRLPNKTALIIVLATVQWVWLLKAVPQLHGSDFGIFFRSVASGEPYVAHAGDPTLASGASFTNLNPPQFLVLVQPFTKLPFWIAAVCWWALSLALLAAGLTWWLREQGETWTLERVAWALVWTPIVSMAFTGQVTALLGVPLWLAFRALSRGRSLRGGLYAGVVLSIKPILWPLAAWYALRREWATLVGMFVGGAAAIAVGIAVFGIRAYGAWIGALRGIVWGAETMNASLPAIGSRLPIATPRTLWLAAGAALAVWTVWRIRHRSISGAWMPLIASSLLASPLGWVYYGAWLLPGTHIDTWTTPAALGWCAPLLAISAVADRSSWLWATVGSCYGLTLLLVWLRACVPPPSVDNGPAVHIDF